MTFPKISIITPSFNQGKYLEQTILSVINQNYPNLEYIIIDGGSTDNSVDIIKKYEKHITYWISEKDKGQSEAINKGLKRVTGDIFNWINSDDNYNGDIFFRLAEYFSDGNVLAVCGRSKIFGETMSERISETSFIDENDFTKTVSLCHIEQPSTFFNMKVVRELGDLSIHLHYLMDKEWWLKYLFQFGTKSTLKTDDVFANFRMHHHSKTMSGDSQFYSNYATILYSLGNQKSLPELCKLLALKYKIDTTYEFRCEALKNIPPEIIKKMLLYFLLKRAHLIFNKNDFIHAKRLIQYINTSGLDFDGEEKEWLSRTKENSSPDNWFLFRVNRKLHHLSGNKK